MHRFHLPPGQCEGPLLTLTGREFHHARDVVRVAPGEEVVVLDGAGRQFHCEVRDLDRQHATLAVTRTTTTPRPPGEITLAQGIPKGKLFESIIQKATELGVARIVPLLSERVVLRLDENGAREKAGKWRQTAIEAIKQCGQPWLPLVEEPLTPAGLLARGEKFDLALAGSLAGDGRHPRQYFQEFQGEHRRRPQSICAWIGPEGDFTEGELGEIREAGARPVSLGPLVLRSDTAALYALSVIAYELSAPVA